MQCPQFNSGTERNDAQPCRALLGRCDRAGLRAEGGTPRGNIIPRKSKKGHLKKSVTSASCSVYALDAGGNRYSQRDESALNTTTWAPLVAAERSESMNRDWHKSPAYAAPFSSRIAARDDVTAMNIERRLGVRLPSTFAAGRIVGLSVIFDVWTLQPKQCVRARRNVAFVLEYSTATPVRFSGSGSWHSRRRPCVCWSLLDSITSRLWLPGDRICSQVPLFQDDRAINSSLLSN